MNYRPEIDGLRALAVIPVVLFHGEISGFEGGYIGVDIFFVISGYLITGIIKEDIERDRFTLRHFYERRARRILPALFAVSLVTFLMACLLLMPAALRDFCQSLVATASFSSNIYFWLKSGYFQPASELSPLLHTWSLAVEEQFYLLFPLLFAAIMATRQWVVFATIFLIGIISLGWSQWAAWHQPSAAFYLTPARAWELMAGCLLAIAYRPQSSRLKCEGFSIAGIALIVLSIVTFSKQTSFPGFAALIPVGGTMLLIWFAQPGTLTAKLLSTRLLVGIGLISYSTYLWHQPLFAFARHISLQPPPQWVFISLAVLSVALGYLSWRWIETPWRHRARFPPKRVVLLATCGTATMLTVGLAGHLSKGFEDIKYAFAPSGFREYVDQVEEGWSARDSLWSDLIPMAAEPFSKTGPSRKVLVLGDSLSEDVYVSLVRNQHRFPDSEFRQFRLDDMCMRYLPKAESNDACGRSVQNFIATGLGTVADSIIVAADWKQDSVQDLRALLDFLDDGKSVLVFETAAFVDMTSLLYAASGSESPVAQWGYFFAKNKHERSRAASVHLRSSMSDETRFINTYKAFCKTDGHAEFCDLIRDGQLLKLDQSHLSIAGADLFGEFIWRENLLDMKM